jgi:UDP-2,4-diacetamido-2,4,6-trideoxy-beta-L-altropyranose hydrolase
MTPLLIRCEATPELGSGHAMRCLALAQEWMRRGGRVVFAMMAPESSLVARMRAAGADVEVLASPVGGRADALATAALARQHGAAWVVVDGPDFGEEWDASFPAALRLLRIDDNGLARAFRADLLLNQNLGAAASNYPARHGSCRMLLGPTYALLRTEFLAAADCAVARGSRIVVTLGGSDPACATERVLEALRRPETQTVEADFIIGAGNPRQATLRTMIDAHAPRLRSVVSPADLPRRFAAAPLVVTAGGTTIYELALLHTPMLLLCTADNQRRTCANFAAADAVRYAGWHADISSSALAKSLADFTADAADRCALAERASTLVDGRGAERVVDVMRGGAT